MSTTFLASHSVVGGLDQFGLKPIHQAFGGATTHSPPALPPGGAQVQTTLPSTSRNGPIPLHTHPLPPQESQTHLQATLIEIQEIANDVEMQPPPSEWGVYIVVDTNILLGYYEALRTFVDDVEKTDVPVVVVIPGIVVQELDRQKNREKLAWPARRASGWLLEKMRLQKAVKVQATEETCKDSRNWRTRVGDELLIPEDMMNDHLILDCAQYFQGLKKGNTVLCSADNNVCIIAHSQGIPTITPPQRGVWTSRDIAQSVYGRDSPFIAGFTASTAVFGRERANPRQAGAPRGGGYAGKPRAPAAGGNEDPDSMVVDDDSSSTEETPLNVLHDDVREYFTRLLMQVATRRGASELRREDASRHAPPYVKKDYRTWNAAECLEYLYDKSPGLKRQMISPCPEVFLSKRYTARGARTGQEWSPRDWKIALENVERVGRAFGDAGLGESVQDLQQYLGVVLLTIDR